MATPSADSEIPTEFTASGQTSLRDLFLEAAEITDPVAGGECDIRIWRTESGELGKRLRGHVDAVESLDYSLDGRWLASASRKGEIKVWTMNSGPSINAGLRFERVADYTLLARDGSGFVRYFCDAAGQQDELEFWTAPALDRIGRRLLPQQRDSRISQSLLLPGARALVLGYSDGTLRLVGLNPEFDVQSRRLYNGVVLSLASTPDGKTLASIGAINGLVAASLCRLPDLTPIGPSLPTLAMTIAISGDRTLALLDGHGGIEWRGPSDLKPGIRSRVYSAAEDVVGDAGARIFRGPAKLPVLPAISE